MMGGGNRGVELIAWICLSLLLVDGAPRHTSKGNDCESGHPADVIFVLDASNSIWRPDFGRQVAFIKELSRLFRIGPSHTQIAVLTYADYPQFQFQFNYYSTKSDILAAIDNIRQMGGYHTSTPEALRMMRERGFSRSSGARTNVTRVGIVITDGNSDEPMKTVAEAGKAKDAGIHLFAVGVGLKLDLSELEAIASEPSKYYTFSVDSYAGLDNIKELLAIKTCTVTNPPPTTTTTTVASTSTTTTTTTTTTTVVPSTEPPLSRRTPKLEGPRFSLGLNPEFLPGSERLEGVEELKETLRHKPKTDGHENDPSRSRHSPDGRGSDTDEELSRGGSGQGRENPRSSGHEGFQEVEWTGKGKGGQGKFPGQAEVDSTQETPDWNDDWDYDDILKQWRPKNGRQWPDARQDGSWVKDKNGQPTWLSKVDVVPVNGTLLPNPTPDADYVVDPVDPGDGKHPRFSSKDGHQKQKPIGSGSKRKGGATGKGDVNAGPKGLNKQSTNRSTAACKPKTPLDVVFMIDAKSRDKRQTRHLWEAVRNVVDQVDMDNGQMRVQFVQSCAKGERLRNRLASKASLLNTIEEVATLPPRSTADLFDAMTTKLTTNGKPGRKKIGVYLTNGPSGDLERTLQAVQEAKNVHDVEMFTLGLGKDLNPVELRAISSCDVRNHMFTAKHSSKVKELARQLTKSLCSVR